MVTHEKTNRKRQYLNKTSDYHMWYNPVWGLSQSGGNIFKVYFWLTGETLDEVDGVRTDNSEGGYFAYKITMFPFSGKYTQSCHGTGETGNLKVHFSRQGKHREFPKNIKNMFYTRYLPPAQGKFQKLKK